MCWKNSALFLKFILLCCHYTSHCVSSCVKYIQKYEFSPNILTSFATLPRQEIIQFHETYRNNIHEFFERSENFERKVEWYLSGLMIIECNQGCEFGKVNHNLSYDEALEFYGCPRLIIESKLELLGDMFFEMSLFDEAVHIFEKCLFLFPGNSASKIELLQKLGNLYSILSCYEESIIMYKDLTILLEEMVQHFPHLTLTVALSQIDNYMKTGQHSNATAEYRKAITYINSTFGNSLNFIRTSQLSVSDYIATKQYHLAELALRDCLNILSLSSLNETKMYLSIRVNYATLLFAQSKWWQGAQLLETLLKDYASVIVTQEEKLILRRLILRTAGAYTLANTSFDMNKKFHDSERCHDMSLKVIRDWYHILSESLSPQSDRHFSNDDTVHSAIHPPSIPPPIQHKGKYHNRRAMTDSKHGHVLDTLVFGTVVLILTSFGLYSFSGVSEQSPSQK